jgi:hypothetical protein
MSIITRRQLNGEVRIREDRKIINRVIMVRLTCRKTGCRMIRRFKKYTCRGLTVIVRHRYPEVKVEEGIERKDKNSSIKLVL